jgi:hypothetical protein
MHERRGRLLALYGAAITRGQRDGSIRAGVSPEVVAVQMWASLLGLGILGAQEATLGLPLDDVASDLVDLFGHALRSRISSVVAAHGRASRGRRSRRA